MFCTPNMHTTGDWHVIEDIARLVERYATTNYLVSIACVAIYKSLSDPPESGFSSLGHRRLSCPIGHG